MIWQSVERHRTSNSECPTTVSAETMSRNGQLVTCSRPQMPTCWDFGDRDTTVGQVHWRFAEQTPTSQYAQLVTDSLSGMSSQCSDR